MNPANRRAAALPSGRQGATGSSIDAEKRREGGATYGAQSIAAFAGVSGHRIGQWARNSLISASAYTGRPRLIYSTSDASEAIVLRWLRKRGFRYERIHREIEKVAEDFKDWPLFAAVGVAQHAVEADSEAYWF